MGKAATVITATLVAVFFSGLANAGRVNVPTRSGSASTVPSSIVSRAGDVVRSGALEGTYIPGYNQDRQIPVKVLNSNDFSAAKTYAAAKDILKKRGPAAAAVAGTAAVMWAVDQVGGFIDDNSQPVHKADTSASDPKCTSGNFCYYWLDNRKATESSSATTTCQRAVSTVGNSNFSFTKVVIANPITCYAFSKEDNMEVAFTQIYKDGDKCTTGTYNQDTGQCVLPSGGSGAPFADADYDKLEAAMNSASGPGTAGDPTFIRDLIRASCEGSLAPQRCYDALAANAPGSASQSLSGPSSVTAPGTSSITVSKDKDGNATSTTTNSTTTFNITYGNNYYNYSSTTTKTKTNPDGSTETTTEEEPEETAEKYPEQPDPLSPVLKEYDKITEAVKTPQETVAGLDSKAWFSFGGSCQELDLDTPIGHIKTNYCPTVESYVKPVLAFIFAVCAYLYCAAIWRETTMNVRPT